MYMRKFHLLGVVLHMRQINMHNCGYVCCINCYARAYLSPVATHSRLSARTKFSTHTNSPEAPSPTCLHHCEPVLHPYQHHFPRYSAYSPEIDLLDPVSNVELSHRDVVLYCLLSSKGLVAILYKLVGVFHNIHRYSLLETGNGMAVRGHRRARGARSTRKRPEAATSRSLHWQSISIVTLSIL